MLFHSHCLCTSEQYLLRPSLVSVLRRRATTLSDIDYSTTKSPDSQFYPFPKTHRPTPHDIFHLPIGASSADVKSRCQSSVHPSIQLDNRPLSQIMNLSGNTILTHLAHGHTHHVLMSETLVSKPSSLPITFCKTLLVE